jgi:hypothetical protein
MKGYNEALEIIKKEEEIVMRIAEIENIMKETLADAEDALEDLDRMNIGNVKLSIKRIEERIKNEDPMRRYTSEVAQDIRKTR